MTDTKLTNLGLLPLLGALLLGLVLGLGACSPGGTAEKASSTAAPTAPTSLPEATAPVDISAPSGSYTLDPTHANLQFSVLHMGLSNYVAGFTDYTVNLQLDSANPTASSVTVGINPSSIRTDYNGDYKGTHPTSTFNTWEEELVMSDKFFNAAAHPEIKFQSTSVTAIDGGPMQIVGDLTLLGKTLPVTLIGKLVGATEQHPFTNKGALGLSVSGTFKRSAFGMDYLLSPPLVGDDVTISFEGEMHPAL